jgi:hypothetical protein
VKTYYLNLRKLNRITFIKMGGGGMLLAILAPLTVQKHGTTEIQGMNGY